MCNVIANSATDEAQIFCCSIGRGTTQVSSSRMSEDKYVIKENPTPVELSGKIAEPILSLVALAILFFFGIDWLLTPIVSFFSQFDWFNAVLSIVDGISSVIEWLDSLNGTGGPSLPFGLPFPSERVLDLLFTLGELAIGIAVIVRALNASILVVDSEGVTINDRSVPWPSIRQVVLIQAHSSASKTGEFEIGLRLAPDASLPDEIDVDVSSPYEIPSALRTSPDGEQFDRERLAAVVDRLAPENVSFTERREEIEQEFEPEDDREAEYETDE